MTEEEILKKRLPSMFASDKIPLYIKSKVIAAMKEYGDLRFIEGRDKTMIAAETNLQNVLADSKKYGNERFIEGRDKALEMAARKATVKHNQRGFTLSQPYVDPVSITCLKLDKDLQP